MGPPGRLRRSAVGEEESRAQSSGEWPCVKTTWREGLVGLLLCVGGGARVEEPGCRGWEREGKGDERLFSGRGERVGGRRGGGMRVCGLGGGAIIVGDEAGAKGAGYGISAAASSRPEREKVGTVSSSPVADTVGVVSWSSAELLIVGGGGGGMATLSTSSLTPSCCFVKVSSSLSVV